MVEFCEPVLQELAQQIAQRYTLHAIRHSLQIFARCPNFARCPYRLG
jgi:Fe2+ or Zn2+ uptake regulation protein